MQGKDKYVDEKREQNIANCSICGSNQENNFSKFQNNKAPTFLPGLF
ncbi:hypothetical protein C942_01352 [Photobacterium marinum]|uniref:Uncharacterized protein n=1 Tax=Photobacterium marinum TaxID=1056511 RepID=L8JGP7_9GAMM|nr:hypothetical protein C942_01352 [Photobacterium marinum]